MVVAFGGNIIVLKVLLPVESDLLSLDFPVFDINLVAYEDNRDVFTNSDQIFVPLGHILISDSGTDIEHDDATVATNATVRLYKE